MKELDNKETEKFAGGSAGLDTVRFKLRLCQGDNWINTYTYTLFRYDRIVSLRKKLVGNHGITNAEQVHLFHPDGHEMTSGTYETNGINNDDTIKAVF